ncbi:MAG TPA: hypothetical protein VFB22_03975 [Candidatus Baltobacteraceae bacterium]|nr:hypothetical protein [Candidatus Baltobacteraceae bacterium]
MHSVRTALTACAAFAAAALAVCAALPGRSALAGLAAPFAARADAALGRARPANPCANARPVPPELRLPRVVPPGDPVAIERRMLAYLQSYRYRELGWCVDKRVRDTGPYVMGVNYGTHRTVRIYYSPEVMTWLRAGRHGAPADGAVIIKEQYGALPAVAWDGKTKPTDWTLMIRRASASRDGWFWAEVYGGMFPAPGPHATPAANTAYPNAGFGLYCLRCHASAEKAQTFSSLDNVKGFPGEPLVFRVDDTWRTPPPRSSLAVTPAPTTVPEHEKNKLEPSLVRRASQSAPSRPVAIQTFPAEPLDTRLASAHGVPRFMTSDQCMGCHSASSGPPTGPTMWYAPNPALSPQPTTPPNGGPVGANVSEYGEWRWSPMGLAGRDPVFFSQLESETQYIASIPDARIGGPHPAEVRATLKRQVVDLCMRCHGVMGKRTNEAEHGAGAHFDERWVFEADPRRPAFHYGGLARDGISCTVCHHIAQTKREQASLAYTLEKTNTGLFDVNAPDRINGPFESKLVATHPMKEALGATPVFSELTKSAQLCTSCHSIDLPVVDSPAKIHPIVPVMAHDVEQNTYVEWVNSRYQTEYKPLKGAKSCQDCHMPPSVAVAPLGVDVPAIQTRIALIQDDTYPEAEHTAPIRDITVRWRTSGFRRHELLGLNAFLLRTFETNPDTLGVRLGDYMSGSTTDLTDAMRFVRQQATQQTARVDVRARVAGGVLRADVGVTNLTGHRFPSGVGFRRAFLELKGHRRRGARRVRFGRDERRRRDRRRERRAAAERNVRTAPQRPAGLPAALRRDASDRERGGSADLRGAGPGSRGRLHRELHPPRPRLQGQPIAAARLARRRAARHSASRALARRDAPGERARRSALRRRLGARRGRLPRSAPNGRGARDAARRGDALVRVVEPPLPARAHVRRRPRRDPAARVAREPAPRADPGPRGLEDADRIGPRSRALTGGSVKGPVRTPRVMGTCHPDVERRVRAAKPHGAVGNARLRTADEAGRRRMPARALGLRLHRDRAARRRGGRSAPPLDPLRAPCVGGSGDRLSRSARRPGATCSG